MKEDKLQAAKLLQKCKDESAEFYGFKTMDELMLYYAGPFHANKPQPNGTIKSVMNRAMQLYAAQCVKDERERIRNAMPSDEEMQNQFFHPIITPDEARLIGEVYGFVLGRLSQLIERAGSESQSDDEMKEMRRLAHQGLPDDCVKGWDEVKFCEIRNGDGNACKWCSHFR